MRRPDKLERPSRNGSTRCSTPTPGCKAAWEALGELHNLYLAKDHKGAMAALDRFADIYGTGLIPEFSDTVDTFLAWHAQILDWHHGAAQQRPHRRHHSLERVRGCRRCR